MLNYKHIESPFLHDHQSVLLIQEEPNPAITCITASDLTSKRNFTLRNRETDGKKDGEKQDNEKPLQTDSERERIKWQMDE